MKYTSVKEFVESIPRERSRGNVDISFGGFVHSVSGGYVDRRLELYYPIHDSDVGSDVIAHLGPYKIVVDNSCMHQKMRVSKRFYEIQSPELVVQTDQWMREFFGYEYPIHSIGNCRVAMHSKTFRELQELVGGR